MPERSPMRPPTSSSCARPSGENKPLLNGRPLTAEDIVKNWERFRTEHPNRAVLANDMDRVEAVAPDTAPFVMKRPLGPFVSHMGHHGVCYIARPVDAIQSPS